MNLLFTVGRLMFKTFLFEIISIFENFFIKKNIRSLVDEDLIFIGDPEASKIFVMAGKVLPSGGSGTALRLASHLIKLDPSYAVVLPCKGVSNLEAILGLFYNVESNKIKATDIQTGTSSIIYTNWQSYYQYSYISSKNKFMFVQDGEFWFFPMGSTYYFSAVPYRDQEVVKICLGDWLVESLAICQGDILSVPFPTTLIPKGNSFGDEKHDNNEIVVLVYVKHSFRRAGGLLLEQLKRANLKIHGYTIKYRVIGYKPSFIFGFGFPKNINFLGYVSEDVMQNELLKCDIGLVYSCTNVSLLPFQLAAYGKPILEILNGGAEISQLDAAVITVDPSFDGLNNSLSAYIKEKKKFDQHASKCSGNIVEISATAQDFDEIIKNY